MKIRVISDVHCEFMRGHAPRFVESLRLREQPPDVLVVAGDLSDSAGLRAALELVCDAAPCPVVYVPGNHEYYGSDKDGVFIALCQARESLNNLRVLEPDGVTSLPGGLSFVGGTLWFSRPERPEWKRGMNDFNVIRGFENWVYIENAQTVADLERNVNSCSIVVTHHLPTRHSVSTRFKDSPLNAFFVTDLTPLILQKRPKLWIHGHTHDSKDYKLGDTRIVCNPFGYYAHEENREFDPMKTIELDVGQPRAVP